MPNRLFLYNIMFTGFRQAIIFFNTDKRVFDLLSIFVDFFIQKCWTSMTIHGIFTIIVIVILAY